MDDNDKAALLFFGIPVAGLIYCFVGIATMMASPFLRSHALVAGGAFALVPFSIGAAIWTRSSARRYARKDSEKR